MTTAVLLGRRTIILLVVMIAAVAGVSNQVRLVNSRKALEEAKNQLAAVRSQIEAANTALLNARTELLNQNDERNRVTLKLAKAEQEFSKVDPEARWAMPPGSLPEWNSESPFVWLRKEMVPQLPVSPFMENGELRPEIGYLLTLDAATQQKLNQELKDLVMQFESIEAAKAERTDEHLPGIASQPGEKITVRIQRQPEEVARFQSELENALRESMGYQRTELLMQTAQGWISQFGSDSKTVSVVRRSSENYGLSVKYGEDWTSMTGPSEAILRGIPANLRPMFAPLFQDSAQDSARVKQ